MTTIESKFGKPPVWWRTPEQQLQRARKLWPNLALPEAPAKFTPQSESEVLLLHVPDKLESLWEKVKVPAGYTRREEDVEVEELCLALNKVELTEPTWLGFDPEHGKGEPADSFWGQANVAGAEVCSALIQFPVWSLTWFAEGVAAPNLSGYRIWYDGVSFVPKLDLMDDDAESVYCLEMCLSYAGNQHGCWASPTVRGC